MRPFGRSPKHEPSVRQKVQTRVCRQPENHGRSSVRTLAAKLLHFHSRCNPGIELLALSLARKGEHSENCRDHSNYEML
jgi:hypothetical protein